MEGRQHTVVDMETLDKLSRMSPEDEEKEWEKRSIYRVPWDMKERNPEAYSPRLVSFEPYHHGKAHLKALEKHKHRALSHRLNRCQRSFEDYVNALSPVVEELMDDYEELEEEWKDRRRFLELMVLDGCFFLEIWPTMAEWVRRSDHNFDYSDKDPIFGHRTLSFDVRDLSMDLEMIENQLPQMVIKRILQMELPGDEERVKRMLRKLDLVDGGGGDNFHYLDGVRKRYVGTHKDVLLRDRRKLDGFYCASYLHRAGILFKCKQGSPVTDITFDGGVLSLPPIPVFRITGTSMLNTVAFERLHCFPGHEVSAYIMFMAKLVLSAEDAKLLRSERIIDTDLSDDRKIVEFIQKLDHDMNYVPGSCYTQQRAAMYEYYENNMKTWKRKLRAWGKDLQDTYLRNPWTIVSLLAGIILLGLTMAQTIFAARSD